MSVRFSQLLVAIVLALVAYALFRTISAYQESILASQLREQGTVIVEQQTQRLGMRVAALENLAASTAIEGYVAPDFSTLAKRIISSDSAVQSIDFFDQDDVRVTHVGGAAATVPPRKLTRTPARPDLRAIELALFDAELSRTTSLSDLRGTLQGAGAPSDGKFFLATRVLRHDRDLGTLIETLDARRLIIAGIASSVSGPFELDDGRGRVLVSTFAAPSSHDSIRQTFPIRFADRVLQLTLVAPSRGEVPQWWFYAGWIALVLAIVWPIEVVGHINRRVQALNEELETRVAARTRQLEESLDESRRLAAVVESVREGVMRIGNDGVIEYVNAALCAELGCTSGDLIGHAVWAVSELNVGDSQLIAVRQEVSASGFVYREMERKRCDGEPYIAGVTFTRHALDKSGTLIAVSRDITARRHLVDELLEANAKSEREMRARTDFIATASHELRTPVTTLRMLAALLLEKLGKSETQSPDEGRLFAILDEETRRLARLVDDLLRIARLDAPEGRLPATDIDIRGVVQAQIEAFDNVGRKGPKLALHLSDEPAVVRADSESIRSIVHNLVANATKFTPPQGQVDVSVQMSNGRVCLTVADTGIGIPKDDLPHVFERFYRSPQAAARAPGAGLGLAIVAKLVESVHGALSIASEAGRGTAVTVEFPLLDATAAPRSTPAQTAGSAAQAGVPGLA